MTSCCLASSPKLMIRTLFQMQLFPACNWIQLTSASSRGESLIRPSGQCERESRTVGKSDWLIVHQYTSHPKSCASWNVSAGFKTWGEMLLFLHILSGQGTKQNALLNSINHLFFVRNESTHATLAWQWPYTTWSRMTIYDRGIMLFIPPRIESALPARDQKVRPISLHCPLLDCEMLSPSTLSLSPTYVFLMQSELLELHNYMFAQIQYSKSRQASVYESQGKHLTQKHVICRAQKIAPDFHGRMIHKEIVFLMS